jgi:hypothetical protein
MRTAVRSTENLARFGKDWMTLQARASTILMINPLSNTPSTERLIHKRGYGRNPLTNGN